MSSLVYDNSISPENSLFSRSDVLGAKLKHSPNTNEPHPCFKICDYDSSKLTNKKLEVLTGERQAHGLIFEERMCVYICKEMIEFEEEFNKKNIQNKKSGSVYMNYLMNGRQIVE